MTGNETGVIQQKGPAATAAVPEIVTAPADGLLDREAGDPRIEIEQLREAMASRAVIEQARGMLMALTSCSSETAWSLLVEISQHSHVKLRGVSAALVASVTEERLPPEIEYAYRQAMARRNANRGS